MSEPILRFENVTLEFDDKLVLHPTTLRIESGETVVLFGVAGSGKTVLMKLAMGLIRPSSGRVFLLGNDITEMREVDLYNLRARVGILFQEGGLFDSLTIEDNVAYPLLNQKSLLAPEEQVLQRVKESLEFVELGHTLDKLLNELSGGMRRRVGIARASVTNPLLLLYDSPTAGLDPITAYTIMSLILKQRQMSKATTLLASHRYQDGSMVANFVWDEERKSVVRAAPEGEFADLRTTFLVMNEGKIVFRGTQRELEDSADPYVSQFVLKQVPPIPIRSIPEARQIQADR